MKAQIIFLSMMTLFGFSGQQVQCGAAEQSYQFEQGCNQVNLFGFVSEITNVSKIRLLQTDVTELIDNINAGLISQNKSDTLKPEAPYKVLKRTPTLNYTIRRIGEGNKVLFSVNNGARKLPKCNFEQSSGTPYSDQEKQGFDNLTFPFKCAISCPIDYATNSFSDLASIINNFEVEIYEKGTWEITFLSHK